MTDHCRVFDATVGVIIMISKFKVKYLLFVLLKIQRLSLMSGRVKVKI